MIGTCYKLLQNSITCYEKEKDLAEMEEMRANKPQDEQTKDELKAWVCAMQLQGSHGQSSVCVCVYIWECSINVALKVLPKKQKCTLVTKLRFWD